MVALTLQQLKSDLRKHASKEKAKILSSFFKTGKGQYGEGDIFLGVTVPNQRKVAKKFISLDFKSIDKLVHSKIHEERLTGLLILVHRFKVSDTKEKKKIFDYYLKNAKQVNNWDLVDLSAPTIVGSYLFDKKSERKVLYKLVNSKNLWEKRISIVSTYSFIKEGDLTDTFKISERLLGDSHDLIHKAVGWMLREAGKKDQPKLEKFLSNHIRKIPRTALRYAIERFEENKRLSFLHM